MKWTLIVIMLSAWDGSPKDWHYVAKYDTQETCEAERNNLMKEAHYARYICANDVVDKAYHP